MKSLNGSAALTSNGQQIGTVAGFWAWSYSDLKAPTSRGDLAEYLVYLSIEEGLSKSHYETRMSWDVVDFVYGKGIREPVETPYFCKSTGYGWGIEVKSASTSSRCGARFKTPERNGHHFTTNRPVRVRRRWADIYVLSLFKDDANLSKNVVEADNWEFYVCPAYSFVTGSVTPRGLGALGFQPVPHKDLRAALDRLIIKDYAALKDWKLQHDNIKREFVERLAAQEIFREGQS